MKNRQREHSSPPEGILSSKLMEIPCDERPDPAEPRAEAPGYNGDRSARPPAKGIRHAASLLSLWLELLPEPGTGRFRSGVGAGQGGAALRHPLHPLPDGQQSPYQATREGRAPSGGIRSGRRLAICEK